jgi:coniferyl-aldehyde dehydrogenase
MIPGQRGWRATFGATANVREPILGDPMPEMQTVKTQSTEAQLRAPFERLRAAYRRDPYPSFEQRIRWLDTITDITKRNADAIAEAVRADFGHRSTHDTKLAECFTLVELVKFIKANLAEWMKPERRSTNVAFLPARNEVRYQPLGVVGIIAPWNYPYQLALAPLAYALAAGNRALVKPSELTPATSALVHRLLRESFDPDLVDVVLGGADVAATFSSLPFDHILFTGSTRVGRMVMEAAARNLTPVTLELGGKSPAIIHPSFPESRAATKLVTGKLFNAGQTCIAPDYLLVQQDKVDETVRAFVEQVPKSYPKLAANPDYSAVINERHRQRLEALVDDAVKKGATKTEVNPARETFDGPEGKMAPVLLTNVDDSMQVMQEEIFGPVLPVVGYRTLHDAIEYVNDHPRPLALYYFDDDANRTDEILMRTVSGGVCVNDTLLHYAQTDLPFGGVGPSGLGAYHGVEGFETFSHRKGVFHQSRLSASGAVAPPYGKAADLFIKVMLGR